MHDHLKLLYSSDPAYPYFRDFAAAGKSVAVVHGPNVSVLAAARDALAELPQLSQAQLADVDAIYTAAHLGLFGKRPCRAPHHTISKAGLLGTSIRPQWGEVALAIHGLLYLEDAIELHRGLLEAALSEARKAGAWVVATAMPCACGRAYSNISPCTCSSATRASYERRLADFVSSCQMELCVRFEQFAA